MLQIFCRFVLLQSLMLWQGGFLFYALVVVPIGGEVLGSEIEQGFITRRVTIWLNSFGAACLVCMALDVRACREHRRARSILLVASSLLLLMLVLLYRRIDGYLDPAAQVISEHREFYRWHAYYLILSGMQWFAMLAAAGLMLAAWQARDAAIRCRDPQPESS